MYKCNQKFNSKSLIIYDLKRFNDYYQYDQSVVKNMEYFQTNISNES